MKKSACQHCKLLPLRQLIVNISYFFHSSQTCKNSHINIFRYKNVQNKNKRVFALNQRFWIYFVCKLEDICKQVHSYLKVHNKYFKSEMSAINYVYNYFCYFFFLIFFFLQPHFKHFYLQPFYSLHNYTFSNLLILYNMIKT